MQTTDPAIVITGAAGFIGSCLTGFLNQKGFRNLILVDEFSTLEKTPNLENKIYSHTVDRDTFFRWLADRQPQVSFVFHIGARTDTTEFDYEVHRKLNLEYSKEVWKYCVTHAIPLVYASSAATYGAGEQGYDDDHEVIDKLLPLNPYGVSKNDFDKWALQTVAKPPFWAGLKFFNVYGPNEYHKGRMASVIWHAFNQIKKTGEVKLFRSHRPDYGDGQQLRDFIHVKDILAVCYWLMKIQPEPGIYNLGTGRARTFYDLAAATFSAQGLEPNIRFIDMPEDIREKYQYFTEAKMDKLRRAGYNETFYSLENGVRDYVQHYLASNQVYY
ncbi:MAG TPA: ADP-glyceromanno-heptose 6-epimerase [Flavitalea sp.]|nr:ADP-glyceromanno-heptose 6-epimerase [Flavitalea sp.]